MHVEEEQLKEFILDSGLISAKDLKVVEREAKSKNERLEQTLLRKGKLNGDELRRIQAMVLGIPFVDLKNQKIDFKTLSLIPEPVARNHNIVAFRKTPESVEIAMLDTDNLAAIDFVRKKVGLKVLPRLTDSQSVKSALLQYQKSLQAEFGEIIKKEATAVKAIPENQAEDISGPDLKKMAEDVPVIRIVDTLLKHAIIQNASDIHIEPMENQVIVRYRIDGLLRDAMILPQNVTLSIVARVKVLANLKLDEKRLPQDGRFKVDMTGEKVSLRVSVLPVYYGEKIVMRLLRENVSGLTLENLGFHGEALERVHAATRLTTGMILTTGPTGSGKTTTLYTTLEILNKPQVNISTIEDPVEYQIGRINQTQVKSDIGLTFASGLRSLVRQDPDVIMVGEIRDSETASLAINASLTGHLVLSTLHTNSAAGAFPRLIDMKAEPFLVVSTVNVVIGQRLVRQLTDKKEKYFLKPAELDDLREVIDMDKVMRFLKEENIVDPKARWEEIPFYKPKTDGKTEESFSGRIGIYEVLKASPAIKELILKDRPDTEIEKQARQEGMMTMIEDGIFKAVQGYTTIEEVLRVVSE
jgi:type IV pilus assembly protein PilB